MQPNNWSLIEKFEKKEQEKPNAAKDEEG